MERFQSIRKENSVNVKREDDGQPQKQPQPPRSAFICFKDNFLKSNESGPSKSKSSILKIVATKWRELSPSDRAHWDEEARNDKVRYIREKAEFKGEWIMPKKRAKKHPLAPKRPPSAFLKFSKHRRGQVKRDNPQLSNTDVSRLLGEMWRNASVEERRPYVEQEIVEREAYKVTIKKWRDTQSSKDAASRTSHQTVQHIGLQQVSRSPEGSPPLPPPPPPLPSPYDPVEPFRLQTVEEACVTAEERTSLEGAFNDISIGSPADQAIYRVPGERPYSERTGDRYGRDIYYRPPPYQHHPSARPVNLEYSYGYSHHSPPPERANQYLQSPPRPEFRGHYSSNKYFGEKPSHPGEYL